QTIRVASRDDHLGSLLAGAPGRLEPDAGAAADHHERLARELGFPTHDAALASRTGRAQSRSGAGAIMGLLPERKAKRFHSRVDTLYLELALGDRFRLTHELVRSLARSRPLPLFVAVGSVGCPGRFAIDPHSEPRWRRSPRWTHDQIHVPGVKAIHDLTVHCVHHDSFSLHGPLTGERPLIEPQPRRNGVHARRVHTCLTGRREPFAPLIPEIALRRSQPTEVSGNLEPTRADPDQL